MTDRAPDCHTAAVPLIQLRLESVRHTRSQERNVLCMVHIRCFTGNVWGSLILDDMQFIYPRYQSFLAHKRPTHTHRHSSPLLVIKHTAPSGHRFLILDASHRPWACSW